MLIAGTLKFSIRSPSENVIGALPLAPLIVAACASTRFNFSPAPGAIFSVDAPCCAFAASGRAGARTAVPASAPMPSAAREKRKVGLPASESVWVREP